MTAAFVNLEDFGAAETELNRVEPIETDGVMPAPDIEAIKVEAYERGYKTGWEDATKSCEEEGKLIAEELARNLKDMDFSYFEARDEISRSMSAFLTDLLSTLFPNILGDSVAMIIEETLSQAEPGLSGTLEVVVSPEDSKRVRHLLDNLKGKEVRLIEEPALASGQASVRAAEATYVLDTQRIAERIREAASMTDTVASQMVANG